jgi:hypothetical protein
LGSAASWPLPPDGLAWGPSARIACAIARPRRCSGSDAPARSKIGQVLRHRHMSTTAIYAKADREALREIARPWPGGRA